MRRIANQWHGWTLGLLWVVGWPGAVLAAQQASLSSQIEALVTDPRLSKMRIGVRVETLGPRPSLVYESHSQELFKPASNQKVLTSAAALTLLPPQFCYRTVLARSGDNLVIIGSGDPSFGDPRMAREAKEPITAVFHRWAEVLKARGLTEIKGDLLFDDYAFEQEHLHPNWERQFNLQNWYTAPVGALNFNDNCVDVVIKRGAKVGDPAVVSLIPTTPWIKLSNKAVTAAKGEPIVKRSGGGPLTISVEGNVSRGNTEQSPLSIAIVDPGAFFASTARTALAGRGIKVIGETRRQQFWQPGGKLPGNLEVLAVHERRLSDFLWRVNKSSQNMFAEALLKTVGAYTGPAPLPRQGTLEGGRNALKGFLASLGLSEELFTIDDGSGLSHDNRVAPIVLTTVLQHMDRHPRREEWRSNLATPEGEGTLERRMKDLNGHVFAKTGHIGGVSSLSGYVLGPDDRGYVFSVLCNDVHKGPSGASHKLQEDICRLLATWPAATSAAGD